MCTIYALHWEPRSLDALQTARSGPTNAIVSDPPETRRNTGDDSAVGPNTQEVRLSSTAKRPRPWDFSECERKNIEIGSSISPHVKDVASPMCPRPTIYWGGWRQILPQFLRNTPGRARHTVRYSLMSGGHEDQLHFQRSWRHSLATVLSEDIIST